MRHVARVFSGRAVVLGAVLSTVVAAESRAAAVEGGSFPKSIQIPGTDVSFLIGGYVKLDLIQDFDAIGNRSGQCP